MEIDKMLNGNPNLSVRLLPLHMKIVESLNLNCEIIDDANIAMGNGFSIGNDAINLAPSREASYPSSTTELRALFSNLFHSVQIHNPLTFRPLFALEMGNKGIDIIPMFPCDTVFDLPEFHDDFVRHFQILP